jgi:hypothetical protein
MSRLLEVCPRCESLLCAYGKARFQCEEREKSQSVEGRDPERLERHGKPYTWKDCLQLRQEIFSHLLRHDAFETQVTNAGIPPLTDAANRESRPPN